MKVKIIAVGKLKEKEYLSLMNEYLKRMPDWKVEIREVKEGGELAAVDDKAFVIALDERGENLQAPKIAKKIESQSIVNFIIGGADGLSDETRQRADLLLAFGAQVWPHKMVRVMLSEQIYRCWSIINSHPYHRE